MRRAPSWQAVLAQLTPSPRDHLTGLPGRAELARRGPHLLRAAHAGGRSAALLVIDLDGFKQVNDTAGHHTGDRVLIEVGRRLREQVRRDDLLVRLGGDEFAILTAPLDRPDEGDDLAAAVLAAIAEPLRTDDLRFSVRASLGMALSGPDGRTVGELLRAADQAMYAAKAQGDGRWHSSRTIRGDELTESALLADLRSPEIASQVVVHYQPQVDAVSGEVVAFESLARWLHPRHGLLMPRQFIPLAERAGAMGPITRAVLDRAVGDLAALQSLAPGARLSINVTRRHLIDRDLVPILLDQLSARRVRTSDVVLEITEPLTRTSPETQDLFAQLNRRGLGVSVRGFGTAGSSLTALWSNPAACEVKIDPSIVRHVRTDPEVVRLVRAVVSAAHGLGIRAVGEGVENGAMGEVLADLGCDVLQGFWVGRPGPLAQMRGQSVRWSRPADPLITEAS